MLEKLGIIMNKTDSKNQQKMWYSFIFKTWNESFYFFTFFSLSLSLSLSHTHTHTEIYTQVKLEKRILK